MVPKDYKVYCFNGEPKYIVVFHNRFNNNEQLSETVYNTDWKCLNISLDNHFAISDITETKPECLNEMLNVTKIICKQFAFVRVDFYIINSMLKFGEITLYTASGFQGMIPCSLDAELGKMLELPKNRDY